MFATKTITAVAFAVALTVAGTAASFAETELPEFGSHEAYTGPNNNYAEGQNPTGPQRPGCVRDFYATADCGPDSGQSFGPYDRAHAFERGDHILR
jgi:hypothetical protein